MEEAKRFGGITRKGWLCSLAGDDAAGALAVFERAASRPDPPEPGWLRPCRLPGSRSLSTWRCCPRGCARRCPSGHLDALLEVRPSGERTHAPKVVVRRCVRRDAEREQTLEHDQRVQRAAAQALRPRQHSHQLGVIRPALPNRAPRQIVKSLEVLTVAGLERQCLAGLRSRAIGAAILRRVNQCDRENKGQVEGHRDAGTAQGDYIGGCVWSKRADPLSVRRTFRPAGTIAQAPKLRTASSSLSNASNTVSRWVISSA